MFPENTNLFKENHFSFSGKKTQRNPLSSHLRAVQGPVWSTHNLLLAYGHRRTKRTGQSLDGEPFRDYTCPVHLSVVQAVSWVPSGPNL